MTNFNDLQTKKSITNFLSHMEQRWRWNAHPFSLTYLQPTYGFDLGTMEDRTEQKIRVITGRPIVRTRQVRFHRNCCYLQVLRAWDREKTCPRLRRTLRSDHLNHLTCHIFHALSCALLHYFSLRK